ncbi:MAG: GAF domain-containing protein [Candidatus Riflebacteria bacterium]|nr:GAF domain-containing protein [Candidatus Riflebacteria bacterium]
MLLECPGCSLRLDVPESAAGKVVSCPKCGSQGIRQITAPAGPKATLTIVDGRNRGFTMSLGDHCSLGRDPKNTCQILDDRISRHHAIIQIRGGTYLFRDMGSLNGSYINDEGKPVVGEVVLCDGDRIRMGDSVLAFAVQAPATSVAGRLSRPGTRARPNVTVVEVQEDASLIQAELDAREEVPSRHQIDVEEDIETVKRAYRKLELAFAIHEELMGAVNLESVLKKVLDMVFNIFPADRGIILLADDQGTFTPRVHKVREKAGVDAEIRVSKTLLKYVHQRGKAILIQDAQRTVGTESILLENVASAMSVPLFRKEKLVGILHVDCSGGEGKAFSAKDLDLLTGIGNQIAIAIDNSLLNKEIERKNEVMGRLGRYLSRELVDQIVSQNIEIEMGGDTKKVTVLFSDVRGFTTLSESLDPKDVVELLNDYFELMVECIFKFGGTLDKYIGDAIMAVWGSPIPDPLGAFNAIQAAIEMQTELAHFNMNREKQGKPPIYMGIGINTGPALAGNLGSPKRMEYTVIGDTVNLASRIEHLTKAGQIIISANTAADVVGYLRADPMPVTKVKGKSQEVRPFLVRGMYSPTNPMFDRRKHRRMRVSIPARVTNVVKSFEEMGVIEDLTEESMSVQVLHGPGHEFSVNDPVQVQFVLEPGEPPLNASGYVGRINYVASTRSQRQPRVVVLITGVQNGFQESIRRLLTLPQVPSQPASAEQPDSQA